MSNLVELFDNVVEFQNYNGVPLAAGKLYVFALGRTRLMDTWSDVDGESLNPNPIILDDIGQCHCYVSDSFDYTIVVCDQFDNEIFSVDKYLLSKGEHSHADVAVAPSEHIGVSSYHVGEVTVYVPYLTGEVGKVYEGIDPIVVNNDVNRISANHIPLGVQDPLYFVEDSETACIIGMSGGIVPEGTMVESSLGFENNKITGYNGSAFSAGNEYEAGNYISINNNILSVTGLSPVPADTASTGLVAEVSADITAMIPDTSDMATQTWVNEQGFLTAHQDISNKLDTTAFSTVSGDFLTAIPSEYITENTLQSGLSSKLDSTAFSAVSGNFLTAHQSLDGLMSANLLEISDNKITGYNGTAFAGQGGTANPQIPVTSTSGISIFESGDQVYFNISADYAFTADLTGKQDSLTFGYHDTAISSIDESAIYDNSAHARINTLAGRISDLSSNKLDTTAFSDVSGTFLTAHQSLAGYATEDWVTAQGYLTAETDWSDTITAASANAYNEATAAIPTGLATEDWVTAQGYLTAHQDLSDYQTTAGMTAYQEAGDYLTTADSGNFLTGVPDTYLQNTDLSTTDGKVTAISGIPLSAGGDVPEGVMVESAVEYNAVNEISGYNGSAIAQYGAEKQWLVHDDTLVHAANSAQYALGVNLSAVAQLLGVDRTLLWSGSKGSVSDVMDLSDSISSFNKVEFIMNEGNTAIPLHSFISNTDGTILYPYFVRTNSNNAEICNLWSLNRQNNDTRLSVAIAVIRTNGTTSGVNAAKFNEIWGIGRKQ